MIFHHRQFGELTFEEKHCIHFPEGIIGFEHLRTFIIINDENAEPFRWLVSVEDPDICFPLLDPCLFVPDYSSTLSIPPLTTIFVVATIGERLERSTVNLKSPIVISDETRQGRQILLDDPRFSVHHPIFPITVTMQESEPC